MGNREVKVGHTEERSKELLECIDEILSQNSVGTKTLERLHGRIVWFRTFVFGRRLNAATRVLSWHSRKPGPSIRVDDQLRSALETLKNHLLSSRQVSINRDINETWIIFTDGAFEPTNAQPASIGGILVNPSGKVVSFFGAYLPQPLLEEFLANRTIQSTSWRFFLCWSRSRYGQSIYWANLWFIIWTTMQQGLLSLGPMPRPTLEQP